MVTNAQLYLAIGVPMLFSLILNPFMFTALNSRITRVEASLSERISDLKDQWCAELRRVGEVLGARLKHLEQRFR